VPSWFVLSAALSVGHHDVRNDALDKSIVIGVMWSDGEWKVECDCVCFGTNVSDVHTVSWDVTGCDLVEKYQCFGCTYCLLGCDYL